MTVKGTQNSVKTTSTSDILAGKKLISSTSQDPSKIQIFKKINFEGNQNSVKSRPIIFGGNQDSVISRPISFGGKNLITLQDPSKIEKEPAPTNINKVETSLNRHITGPGAGIVGKKISDW